MPGTDDEIRAKECPVCFDTMRIHTRERFERIPGSGQTVRLVVRQWECPDCSHEEVEDEDGNG
ncbi:MAG: hypothetical protein WCP29_00450 [Acidobacteriota bacterium]